ncbi:MAG: NUDIX domain-containing protein [Bacteroidales bacterium]|nr:NUDIX domain-containing protein [Bacteroidales bacterium]
MTGRSEAENVPMRTIMSCGVLLFRREPELSYLLLTHPRGFDLPKGHRDPGETEQMCALRELVEETGLPAEAVTLDPRFQFQSCYYPRYRRLGGEVVQKTVTIFLGWLNQDAPIVVSEHTGHEWVAWPPPRQYGNGTIDGALDEAGRLFADQE